jgi:hypothetical protein
MKRIATIFLRFASLASSLALFFCTQARQRSSSDCGLFIRIGHPCRFPGLAILRCCATSAGVRSILSGVDVGAICIRHFKVS